MAKHMDLPKLTIRLAPEKRLFMTFALRQSLEILTMPQEELSLWLREEVEKNPLLEFTYPLKAKAQRPIDIERCSTLYEHLDAQIRDHFPEPRQLALAKKIMTHLDERGYVEDLPEDPELLSLLPTLQTFDPPGIFARNLQECLLLQLEKNSLAYTIVKEFFKELLQGRFSFIQKSIGSFDFSSLISKLSRLNLRPADLFKKEIVAKASADLRISKIEKTWVLETDEEELPKIRIHSEYLSVIPESIAEREALKTWSTSAKWLMRSLKRRRKLLLDIGSFLVRKQGAFLEGKGDLCPLSMKELAEHLELHESTVSRAISGKFAVTPRGFLPLRSLFSLTQDTAKSALERLVDCEDKKHPLTDEELVQALKAIGHQVARRTIAKYRRQLKISSSNRRKYLSF
jgi:RNA polymerase sigma-54 factor